MLCDNLWWVCLLFEGTLLNMHLAAFSFSKNASIRGPPEHDTVRLLLDEILLDGFITQGEPLLITQPADIIAESEASGAILFVENQLEKFRELQRKYSCN